MLYYNILNPGVKIMNIINFIIRKNLFLMFAIIVAVVLGSCFSPWKGEAGEGYLTINLGGTSRAMVTSEEIAAMEHEITLTGPGETITRNVTGVGAATFNVVAGTWTVSVRAVGDTPEDYNLDDDLPADIFPPRILRALGETVVTVKTGETTTAAVTMVNIMEVTSFEQLRKAIEMASDDGEEEIIVIKNSFDFPYDISDIWIDMNKNITLIAEETVTISRESGGSSGFFSINDGRLNLGKSGMRG